MLERARNGNAWREPFWRGRTEFYLTQILVEGNNLKHLGDLPPSQTGIEPVARTLGQQAASFAAEARQALEARDSPRFDAIVSSNAAEVQREMELLQGMLRAHGEE